MCGMNAAGSERNFDSETNLPRDNQTTVNREKKTKKGCTVMYPPADCLHDLDVDGSSASVVSIVFELVISDNTLRTFPYCERESCLTRYSRNYGADIQ